MAFRSRRLPAQILWNCQKIMLAISHIWLCLLWDNFSILTKNPILGQAPNDGWGGRIRTYECQDQNLVPYRLATPQY